MQPIGIDHVLGRAPVQILCNGDDPTVANTKVGWENAYVAYERPSRDD
jgi:hypothetical protein